MGKIIEVNGHPVEVFVTEITEELKEDISCDIFVGTYEGKNWRVMDYDFNNTTVKKKISWVAFVLGCLSIGAFFLLWYLIF